MYFFANPWEKYSGPNALLAARPVVAAPSKSQIFRQIFPTLRAPTPVASAKAPVRPSDAAQSDLTRLARAVKPNPVAAFAKGAGLGSLRLSARSGLGALGDASGYAIVAGITIADPHIGDEFMNGWNTCNAGAKQVHSSWLGWSKTKPGPVDVNAKVAKAQGNPAAETFVAQWKQECQALADTVSKAGQWDTDGIFKCGRSSNAELRYWDACYALQAKLNSIMSVNYPAPPQVQLPPNDPGPGSSAGGSSSYNYNTGSSRGASTAGGAETPMWLPIVGGIGFLGLAALVYFIAKPKRS